MEVRRKKAEDAKRLGEAYYMQGSHSKALKALLEAEKLNPDDAELQNDLGLTYRAKERYDFAIAHFKKALAIDPKDGRAKNNLGTAYLDIQKWDMAIPIFKELLEDLTYITPQYPLFSLGWSYHNKNDYQLAERYYREALTHDPNFIKARRGLGLTYKAMGRVREAIFIFEKTIKLSPQVPHLHYDLGELYALTGEYQKAREAYSTVMKLVPNSPLAAEAELIATKLP
jgi:tetratricopeptide (TPR) repeat protein